MFGYSGSILHLNLGKKSVSTIATQTYSRWIGGHGIAAAIFFDLVKDKTINAFDPENTLVLMSGRFAGTLAPAAGRMEIVGVQSQTYPDEWFGSANMGGRFPAMLKYAGFDGIVIEGQADAPTWVNICDGEVSFEEATGLWGLDTYDTQRVIFRKVLSRRDERRYGGTSQLPAVLAIGPAGENSEPDRDDPAGRRLGLRSRRIRRCVGGKEPEGYQCAGRRFRGGRRSPGSVRHNPLGAGDTSVRISTIRGSIPGRNTSPPTSAAIPGDAGPSSTNREGPTAASAVT